MTKKPKKRKPKGQKRKRKDKYTSLKELAIELKTERDRLNRLLADNEYEVCVAKDKFAREWVPRIKAWSDGIHQLLTELSLHIHGPYPLVSRHKR